MLSIKGISVGYDSIPVIRNVSFEIGQGEVVALIGRNGVGKSTLVKALMGLLPAVAGHVAFDGAPILRLPAQERVRLGFGYVPQGREIFANLSVEENLRLGKRVGSGPFDIERALRRFPFLRDCLARSGAALSGGQQQMLAIGRILVGNPRLLILDEPSDGIQPNIVEQIGALIRELNQETGLTTLLVEQNVDLISACAHRCLVMEKGAVVAEMRPDALEDPETAGRYLAI
jgi:ABC-type branched-subunit amino acid transport system ATPase component